MRSRARFKACVLTPVLPPQHFCPFQWGYISRHSVLTPLVGVPYFFLLNITMFLITFVVWYPRTQWFPSFFSGLIWLFQECCVYTHFINVYSIFLVCGERNTPSFAQDLICSGITAGSIWETIYNLGIKPVLAICKTSALTLILPLKLFYWRMPLKSW